MSGLEVLFKNVKKWRCQSGKDKWDLSSSNIQAPFCSSSKSHRTQKLLPNSGASP